MSRQWCHLPQFIAFSKARSEFWQAARAFVKKSPLKRIQYGRWAERTRRLKPDEFAPQVAKYTRQLTDIRQKYDDVASSSLQADETPLPDTKLTIMSYNILCGNHMLEPPTRGFEHHSVWITRMELICRHIQQCLPDVVCMQEVDVPGWWAEQLDELGYTLVYHARTDERSRASVDGCAIAYRRDKLKLVTHTAVRYCHHPSFMSRTQIGLAGLFEVITPPESTDATSPNYVCITTSHFLWNARRGEAKLAQLQSCLNGLGTWFRALEQAAALAQDDTTESKVASTSATETKQQDVYLAESKDGYYFDTRLCEYRLPDARDVNVSSQTTESSPFPEACAPKSAQSVTGPKIKSRRDSKSSSSSTTAASEPESAESPGHAALYTNQAAYIPALTAQPADPYFGQRFPPMTVMRLVQHDGNAEARQMAEANYLLALAEELRLHSIPSNILERTAFVICGDFNATPTSRVSEFMRTSVVDVESTYGDTMESIAQPAESVGIKRMLSTLPAELTAAITATNSSSRIHSKHQNTSNATDIYDLLNSSRGEASIRSEKVAKAQTELFDWSQPKVAPAISTLFDGTELTFANWSKLAEASRGRSLPWVSNQETESRMRVGQPEPASQDSADDMSTSNPSHTRASRRAQKRAMNTNEPMDGEVDLVADALGYPGEYVTRDADAPTFDRRSNASPARSKVQKRLRMSAPQLAALAQLLNDVTFSISDEVAEKVIASIENTRGQTNTRVKFNSTTKQQAKSASASSDNVLSTTETAEASSGSSHLSQANQNQQRIVEAINRVLWMNQRPIDFQQIKDQALVPLSSADVYASIALAAQHAYQSYLDIGSNPPLREIRTARTVVEVVQPNELRVTGSTVQDATAVTTRTETSTRIVQVHTRAPVFHPFIGLTSAYQAPGMPTSYRCTGIQPPGRYQVDYIYFSPLSVARMLELDQLRSETLRTMAKHATTQLATRALGVSISDLFEAEVTEDQGVTSSEETKEEKSSKLTDVAASSSSSSSSSSSMDVNVGTGLRLDAVLDLPSDTITFYKNFHAPSAHHGSDHLSIMAAFTLITEKTPQP